jgi:hypothetical protein
MFRLSHIRHTGYRLHRHHTSYAALVFLLLITGVVLSAAGQAVKAEEVAVIATVPEPPPNQAAVIITPKNNDRFRDLPITISGNCPAGTLVKIFNNGIFVGATLCNGARSFALQIDLFIGRNDLVARVFNTNEQPGPDSATVSVFYDLPGGLVPPQVPLLIRSENLYKGIFVGQELKWTAEIVGGSPPYAVNWDWGDGRSELYSRKEAGRFTVNHTYARPGKGYKNTYDLIIRATDDAGNKAFLQLVTIVNPEEGQHMPLIGGGKLNIAWPLLALAVLMVASFYIGERREKRLLQRKNPSLAI